MEKITQEKINRESVKESLLTLSGGDKRLSLYFGVITGVIVLPFVCLFFSSAVHNITAGDGFLDIFSPILVALIFAAFPTVFLCVYFFSRGRVAKIKKGMFTVKTDRVTYMTERMQYTGKHSRLVKVLEFRDSGEVEVDGVTYSYTSHGDEFYLVFIDGDKKPALTYACKIYDYNE